MNSEKVYVLATLDMLLNHLWNPFEPDNQSDKYKRLVEARSAVSELIWTARSYERECNVHLMDGAYRRDCRNAMFCALDRIGDEA